MTATVFSLEWLLASRRGRHHRLRAVFLVVLFSEVFFFHASILPFLLQDNRAGLATLIERFQAFFYLLLGQQPIAIALLAPAMSAGSISDEKQRGTLDFLLLSPISSAELVLGKWLAVSSQLFALVCPAYGLLAVLVGVLSGAFEQLIAMLAFHLLLIGALAAVGLLASVWARTTMRAVLGVYLFLGAALALAYAFDLPIFGFDFSPAGDDDFWPRHGPTASFLLAVTLLCLTVAIARLRPAYERQRASTGSTAARAGRAHAVGDSPVRWKERFAGDWAALPVWSILPPWCRLVVVTLATACATMIPPIGEERIILLSLAVFVLSSLWVGVRCAGSITSEREKQTWDALLVTLLDARQIVRGKLWGNLDAVIPYAIAYLPPALLGALLAGPTAMVCVGYFWLAGWVFMYFIGACGLYASARSTSTWRSLIAALGRAIGMTLFAGLIVGVPTTFSFLCGTCFIQCAGNNLTTPFVVLALLIVVVSPMLLWLFAHTESLLETTEQEWLILKENAGRIGQWED